MRYQRAFSHIFVHFMVDMLGNVRNIEHINREDMHMFTMDNTEGFTAAELATLNAALKIRMDRGEDEKSARDIINNRWVEGATVEDLI